MSGWDSAAFDRWLTTEPEIPEDDSEESYLQWLAFVTGKATEEKWRASTTRSIQSVAGRVTAESVRAIRRIVTVLTGRVGRLPAAG